jgi:hypothetical protein
VLGLSLGLNRKPIVIAGLDPAIHADLWCERLSGRIRALRNLIGGFAAMR